MATTLNLAGASFDFGNVLFAVLQECEHHRRGLVEKDASRRLLEIAREKLGEIRESYVESGGSDAYWQELEQEVMENAMPQYAAAALEQNRLERSNYDLWRGGDAVARGLLTLGGLTLGGLMIAAPFIPIWEDVFAFLLAGGGFFWPEIKRTVADYRHSRFLNKLIVQAEKYQKDSRIHYVSSRRFDEALRSLATGETRQEDPAVPDERRMGPEAEEPVSDESASPAGRGPGRERA